MIGLVVVVLIKLDVLDVVVGFVVDNEVLDEVVDNVLVINLVVDVVVNGFDVVKIIDVLVEEDVIGFDDVDDKLEVLVDLLLDVVEVLGLSVEVEIDLEDVVVSLEVLDRVVRGINEIVVVLVTEVVIKSGGPVVDTTVDPPHPQ